MGDTQLGSETAKAHASATPEAASTNHDDRREHLAIERAFVLRGLRELVENTEGM